MGDTNSTFRLVSFLLICNPLTLKCVLWCYFVFTIGRSTRLSGRSLLWFPSRNVNRESPSPLLSLSVFVSAFLSADLQQAALCLSQCPARCNLAISEDSLWMDSWLAVTDAAVCIVCLICVWTLLSEAHCVVSMLFMCTSVVLQGCLHTSCSPWPPQQQKYSVYCQIIEVVMPQFCNAVKRLWECYLTKCVG